MALQLDGQKRPLRRSMGFVCDMHDGRRAAGALITLLVTRTPSSQLSQMCNVFWTHD
jgi:hypothetical protein